MSSSFVTSSLFRFGFPLLILSVVLMRMDSVILFTSSNLGFVTNLPYILLCVAILLCHTFKQGRMAMVSITMLFAYFIIQTRLQSPLSTGNTLLEISLLTTLLPIACLLVYLFPDTGVNSKSLLGYVCVVILFLVWSQLTILHFNDGGFNTWSQNVLFSIPALSKLPLLLILYGIALSGVTAIMVLVYNRAIDVVVYSAILLSSTAFSFFHIQFISSTVFSLSGMLIIGYVVSASHSMAFIDRLTNIPGRRALELDSKHLGRKFSIAMVDIDHFKKFNDTYGHDVGDEVLKLVAAHLAHTTGGARAYRYGGEEFTILFKGKLSGQAKQHLKTVLSDIADYDINVRDISTRPEDNDLGVKSRGKATASRQSVNVTISIGLADSTTSRQPEEVLKAADEALYKAKKTGRNRLVDR